MSFSVPHMFAAGIFRSYIRPVRSEGPPIKLSLTSFGAIRRRRPLSFGQGRRWRLRHPLHAAGVSDDLIIEAFLLEVTVLLRHILVQSGESLDPHLCHWFSS